MLLDLDVAYNLLSESVIHSEYVIQYLDRRDRKAYDRLRQHLLLSASTLRELERLVPRKQDGRYHLRNAEELRVLHNEEDVLAYLLALLIDRPAHRVS